MKDLMTEQNVVAVVEATLDTMTSSELAEVLGYTKKEVNRKIKEFFKDEIDGGKLSPSIDSRGYVTEYHLPEIESNMFVARWDYTHLRTLADFWVNKKQPVQTLPDFNNPAIAARAWAEQYEQKQQALLEVKQHQEQLTLAAPKVEFFDQVSDTSLVASMGNVAKTFNVGRNKMFKQLRQMKILQSNNVPYQRYINAGYFSVKETMKYNHLSYTTYVTGKGQTYLYKKLKEAEFII